MLSTVLTEGFKTSFSSLDFNVYCAGIYFAVDAKLSVFFLTRNPATLEPIAPDEDGCYTLVLSAVLLGKTGVREPLMGGTEKQKKGMENAIKRDLQLADVGTAPRGFPQLQSMGAIIHGEA